MCSAASSGGAPGRDRQGAVLICEAGVHSTPLPPTTHLATRKRKETY